MPSRTVKPTPQQVEARKRYHEIPAKTKADPERFTKTPHEYGDILIQGGKLGGPLQRDLLYWIERKTWGDPKRPEFAKLSLTQFAKLCQTWDPDKAKLRPCERKSVAVALADLERRGIIEARDRKGCGPTTAKMYKLTPEKWKAAAPYTPPTPAQIEEAEIEADEQAEDDATPAETEATAEKTVAPGKTSAAHPVALSIAKDAPAVTIRVRYNPMGFETPIRFRAVTAPNGNLTIQASPADGETKANRCSRTQPQSFAKSSPSKSVATVEHERLTLYSGFISDFLLARWGKSADQQLIDSIVCASQGAPFSVFERIVVEKFSNARRDQRHSPGLLVKLAEDAGRAHQAMERENSTRIAAQRAGRPALPQGPDADCGRCNGHGTLTNEDASERPCPDCNRRRA